MTISPRRLLILLSLIACSGCATVVEGRSQQITIATDPAGATCAVKSNDDVLGVVESTPGVVTIEKSKNDVLVECSKSGYVTGKKKNLSDIAISGLGNMAFLQFGFVGNILDSASGAAHKYDSKIFIALEKEPVVAQNAQPPAAPQSLPLPIVQVMTAAGPQPMQLVFIPAAAESYAQPETPAP